MATDAEAPLERAYPYCAGWTVMACGVLLCGIIGVGGVSLMPVGCEKMRNGEMAFGMVVVAAGLFTAPMLLMAVLALVLGIRDVVRPPLLRLTPTALRWLTLSIANGKEGEKVL